ncbi:MAG: MFS transporter [Chloroflexi bacterium]|nr:MFS transporter [Chloroflexota bacterium]
MKGTATGRVFYGWVIVGVMGATGALSMALGSLNFGLFIRPMGDELGIGRSAFGWAQTSRQLASAATSPLVGWLIDRFGSRVLLALAAAITGAALVAMALVSQAWQMVALFAAMGLVGMSGPGALVTSVPVAKWFVRRRGMALAVMSLGIPVGGVLFVPLTQMLIDGFGWRMAWVVLAALGAGIIVPLSLVLVRRQPEDLGLAPDGAVLARGAADGPGTPARNAPPPLAAEETSWTLPEALRSPTFWRLVLVFGLATLSTSTVALHRIPHFVDRGLDARLVSYATAMDAALAGISTFFLGLLVRRVPARFLGAIAFALLGAATYFTIVADSATWLFLAMGVFGIGVGGWLLLQNYLWAEYFGRHHLGSIRGVVMPVTLVFGGAGAPVAGYVRDATGSYAAIWWAGAGLLLVAGLILALTPAPRQRLAAGPAPAR